MDARSIASRLKSYFKSIEDRSVSERQAQREMASIEAVVPNSKFTDIVFYGERHRTFDEMAEEALERERVYARDGSEGLARRIREQLEQAIADPANTEPYSIIARESLERLHRELDPN